MESLTYPSFKTNIFPNPFSIQTTLQTEVSLKDATLKIFNSFGQQINKINHINGQTIFLPRNNLLSGLYFLQLVQENNIISTSKIVISDDK